MQAALPDPWLAIGVDTLVQAMPASMQTSAAGIEFAADGGVSVGPEFRTLEAAWMEGVAAGREVARGDRVRGMAVSQAEVVHQGVVHDLEVDTTQTESLVCARSIAAHVR
jgi:chloramphenicol 3-O phosphotransferase